MNIRRKLTIMFGAVACLSAILAGVTWLSFSSISVDLTRLRVDTLPENRIVHRIHNDLSEIESKVARFFIRAVHPQLESDLNTKELAQSLDGLFEAVHADLLELKGMANNGVQMAKADGEAEEIAWEREENEMCESMLRQFEQVRDAMRQMLELYATNQRLDSNLWFEEVVPALDQLKTAMHSYSDGIEMEVHSQSKDIAKTMDYAEQWIILGVALIFVCALGLALYATSNIARPLVQLNQAVYQIRHGDWNARVAVQRSDEMGQLASGFNEMTQSLRESTFSKGFLDNIINSMAHGLVVTNDQCKIESVNEAAARLFGIGREELLGRCLAQVMGLPVSSQEELQKCEVISGLELELKNAQGEVRHVLLSSTFLADSQRERRKRVCTFIDITERKKNERERQELSEQLIKASRQAGMTEVATGVLHNVGNVLNSVNVSAGLLKESLSKSQVQNLVKATQLLRDHAVDTVAFLTSDPRGQRLPGYLLKLSEHLVAEQNSWCVELTDLGKNIEHIKQIVSMQQSYAKQSGTAERLSADSLLEDAVRMNEGALGRHGIRIIREYQPVPQVLVDKHKVLQILINLIRNAKHAIDEAGRLDKILVLRTAEGPEGVVHIVVQDNGVGISPENLAKIFKHGFTTKQDGHGFGLHSSINAAREMGGNLIVHSNGLGAGAVFTLELPVTQKKEAQVTT